ncbi:hypothetical protein [Oribacterium sp. oral taxon 078]|mgnify:FL=1|uniref:hypothetical protein n=1 Tax=Oribacterium sp. oral taxon 078 TaxID=652706 RepID=UPI0001BCC459|nr:hypothetical protein [Oribacterium sp. oral taxon 078]
MKNGKILGLGFAVALLTGLSFPALAASTKTPINHVTLSIDAGDIEIGSASKTISVDAAEDSYEVTNSSGTAINMEGAKWANNVTPKFKITIKADSDHRFDTNALKSAAFYTLNGASASFVKAQGSSNSITLTVKLPKLKGNTSDLGVADLQWQDDSASATWTGSDNAQKYYVKLYRGSSLVTSGETTNTSYDFSSAITQNGTYTYKVRAFAYGTYGEWDTSDELEVTDVNSIRQNNPTPNTGGRWILDNVGWWWLNPDRTYPRNTWKFINNAWYYFDGTGYIYINRWFHYNRDNNWYYFGQSGAMLTNARTPDGYYVNGAGIWTR